MEGNLWKDKEFKRAYGRMYRHTYYPANKKKIKKQSYAYYKKYPERQKLALKKYYEKNKLAFYFYQAFRKEMGK